MANDSISEQLKKISMEGWLTNNLGINGYYLMGTLLFALMGWILYRVGVKRSDKQQL
jgi:hypothetical protein